MSLPRISIVMPSYNQASYLEEAIRSVLSQGYPNLEYIMIDGGSSDASTEIIERYRSCFAYAVSEPDRGQTHAVNKGMERATGDVVAFLNSDDLYLPRALHSVARYFTEHPDAEMIYASALRTDAAGKVFERVVAPDFDLERLLRTCYIRQPAVFMRRSLFDRAGLFDESLRRCMDYDYWLRVSRVTTPHPVRFWAAADRFHFEAKSSGPISDTLREQVRVVGRYLDETGLATQRPELARSALLPRLLILAGEGSGAGEDERAAYLTRLRSMPRPSLGELVDTIGGHDGYSGSRYMSRDARTRRVDTFRVVPALLHGEIVAPELASEALRRLSILADLRSAVVNNSGLYPLQAARSIARNRWLVGTRPFWVYTARGYSQGRNLAVVLARLHVHARMLLRVAARPSRRRPPPSSHP